MTTTEIRIAESDDELLACFPVIAQLRTHLRQEDFVEKVRRQEAQGFRLAYLTDGHAVRTVAGFRILETLAAGRDRILFVDDLVTDDAARSSGYGERMMEWLISLARESDCDELHLDSAVHRFAAHRFYFRNRLAISAHHFSLSLRDD